MRRTTSWWFFWGSIGLIIYTYIGFPILMFLRGRLRSHQRTYPVQQPRISFIIAAYNEASTIRQKLDNTFALDYPRSLLEVIVASDGSADGTDDIVTAYDAPEVKLLRLPRQGKNLTLNAAVAAAQGDILIFSDADSMLKPDALGYLVAPFSDPQVGGVGGDYRYTSEQNENVGEQSYWNFDRLLKQIQSRAWSMTSATGQIYALRRSLFVPLPLGVTDDFFTSVQAPIAHRRLVFEPRAIAYGPVTSSNLEFRRKVRVMTAGLRGVWLVRQGLNPVRYGFFAVQLFSHKVLRRLMVVPLLTLAVSAPCLWQRGRLYKIATIGQWSLHSAGILGYVLRNSRLGRTKVLSLPYFFDMVNVAAIVAVINLLRGERHDIWVPQRAGFVSNSGNPSPDRPI